jgi:hypothetical protein
MKKQNMLLLGAAALGAWWLWKRSQAPATSTSSSDAAVTQRGATGFQVAQAGATGFDASGLQFGN